MRIKGVDRNTGVLVKGVVYADHTVDLIETAEHDRGVGCSIVSDNPADDDRPRGLSRYAVRFVGGPMAAATAALEAQNLRSISSGAFWPSSSSGPPFEDHTAVGVHATSREDAVRKVREALEGHGEFADFEATPLGDAPDAEDA